MIEQPKIEYMEGQAIAQSAQDLVPLLYRRGREVADGDDAGYDHDDLRQVFVERR